MACGNIAWWREPDPTALLARYGEAEHLVVQGDFVLQARRSPRMEFAIPGASKTRSGKTGYADLVAVATSEIWEIKPESEVDKAPAEVAWYVKNAKASCGPDWRPGTSYTTRNGTGVVYTTSGPLSKAELIAEQRGPGVVVYYWRIDGKKKKILPKEYVHEVRDRIVKEYFPRGMVLLPDAGPEPNNVPPVKWKPPLLLPDGLDPRLLRLPGPGPTRFRSAILEMAKSTRAQRISDGGAIAVVVEQTVYDRIVGPAEVERKLAMMRVHSDPTVYLYRKTLLVLTSIGAGGQGLVATGIGGAWLLAEVWAVGDAILGIFKFFKGKYEQVKTASTLLDTLRGSVEGSSIARTAAADGASVVVFATPHADSKDPKTPVSISVSVPLCRVLTPREAESISPGQEVTEGVVVALLTTGPD